MEFFERLNKAFKLLDYTATEEELDKFFKFYNELVEYNKNVNLTAITNVDDFIYKHIIDSLIPYNFISQFSTVLDVGAGAGFPSIPLKIIKPKLRITCLDSVNKKVTWLNYIKKQLNLFDFDAIHGRCEDLACDYRYRESFDCVVARGVANLSTLIEYCVPFVKTGGYFIAYKASDFKNELLCAKNAIKLLNIKLFKTINFYNENIGERNVLIFKKIDKTSVKYPRKQNKPRLNPL